MYHAPLHRYALLLSFATLLLLIAGGLVTSNDAGLALGSWPLVEPGATPASPGVFYEAGHRVAASAVGLLTVGLAVFLWRVDRRVWMRWLGVAAVAAVMAQGMLGGFAVRWMLPQAASVLHAVTAGLFFATTVAVAVLTSRSWMEGTPRPVESGRGLPLFALAAIAAAALLVQTALGAAVRHNAIGMVPHIASGTIAGVLGLWAVWRVLLRHGAHTQLRRSALALLSLGMSQAVLGMGAWLSRAALAQSPQPPPGLALAFTVSHVAAGSAALSAAVVLAIYARKRTGRAAARPEAA